MKRTLIAFAFFSSCGFAPVQRSAIPQPPPLYRYLSEHGRPLAYQGGVCELRSPHTHIYPPTPKDAFVSIGGGYADTRTIYPYFGPHPVLKRQCTIDAWHLHLEAPDASMEFDQKRNAYIVKLLD